MGEPVRSILKTSGNKGKHPTNGFDKRRTPGPGRPKGLQNRITTDAKAHILRVFDELQKSPNTSLKSIAKQKPDWFYESIWKAIVPKELKADVNHDIVGNLMELAVQVHRDLNKPSPAGATSSPAYPQGAGPTTAPTPKEDKTG